MVSGSNSGKNSKKKKLRKSKKKGRREPSYCPSELFFVLMSRHWLHAVTKTLMYHTTTTTTTSSSLPTAIGSMFDPLEKSLQTFNSSLPPIFYITLPSEQRTVSLMRASWVCLHFITQRSLALWPKWLKGGGSSGG